MRAQVVIDDPIYADAHIEIDGLTMALSALARRLEDAGERAPVLARATVRLDIGRAFAAIRAMDGAGGLDSAVDAIAAIQDTFEALL